MKRVTTALVAVGIMLAAAGCSAAREDRPSEAGGNQPDSWGDTTKVTVYRNVDKVPNIALFCVGKLRFASTLSGDREAGNILRLPEQDALCGAQ